MASVISHDSRLSRESAKTIKDVAQKSASKIHQMENKTVDEDLLTSSWNAFGNYIARQLRLGKAVTVPKFGTFTFTAADVDLAGTTNQFERDKQLRSPVFIVSKDFVKGFPLKAGIANSSGVRPFDVKGSNGMIPQVKANFTDIGIVGGNSKDVARLSIERVLRQIGDKIRRGENNKMEIPHVGNLITRNGIVAVTFFADLVGETRGATGRNLLLVRNPFHTNLTKSNLLHHEVTTSGINTGLRSVKALTITPDGERWLRDNLGVNAEDIERSTTKSSRPAKERLFHSVKPSTADPNYGRSKSLRRFGSLVNENNFEYGGEATRVRPVTTSDINGAFVQLLIDNFARLGLSFSKKDSKNIKAINYQEFISCIKEVDNSNIMAANINKLVAITNSRDADKIYYEKFLTALPKVQVELESAGFGGGLRPMTAPKSIHSHSSGGSFRPKSAITGTSKVSSVRINNVSPYLVRSAANEIYKNKTNVREAAKDKGINLRDKLSPSQILSILRRAKINLNIEHVIALLRELKLEEVGASVTFLDLFRKCHIYLYGTDMIDDTQNEDSFSPKAEYSRGGSEYVNKELIERIKDFLYSSKRTLNELYAEVKTEEDFMDRAGLEHLLNKYSKNTLTKSDIHSAFSIASEGRSVITFDSFQRYFKWSMPSSDFEIKAITYIRDWMLVNNLGSEQAFGKLLTYKPHTMDKRLNLEEFTKALRAEKFKFTAPQIEYFFKLLDDNNDGYVAEREWVNKIYDDSTNPIQMLREVVLQNELTADDLLHKMKLKVWDDNLDYNKFCEVMKKLDPGLNNNQLKNMAKALKGPDNKVAIPILVRNLTGQEFETVDYQKKIFAQLGSLIQSKNKEKELKDLFEGYDRENHGTLDPLDVKNALQKIKVNISELDLERFLRFVDKDNKGNIDYMGFLEKMNKTTNKNYNPFMSVIKRLQFFLSQNNLTPELLVKRLCHSYPDDASGRKVKIHAFADFVRNKVDKKRAFGEVTDVASLVDVDKDGYIDELDIKTCLGNLQNEAFYGDNGKALTMSGFSSMNGGGKFFPTEKLPEEKALEVSRQVRQALVNKGVSYRDAFNKIDDNNDGFLSYMEFARGIDAYITLSQPIKEKYYALMDEQSIGLVDYPHFLSTLMMSSASKQKSSITDTFDWEENTIKEIKEWAKKENLSAEEVFKVFDRDFDGEVNKEDLNWALVNLVKIPQDSFNTPKLDRLFRLLDQFKTGKVLLSDFQRLISSSQSFSITNGIRTGRVTFNTNASQDPMTSYDWKLNAIQQIGLTLSKLFTSIKESFEVASERLLQINFTKFTKFIHQYNILVGFNLTNQLIQQLFSELDPHKKGYLTENDWINAFGGYNWSNQCMDELKNAMGSAFTDIESAFEFLIGFKKTGPTSPTSGDKISKKAFSEGVSSLSSNRFKSDEIDILWQKCAGSSTAQTLSLVQFKNVFGSAQFNGKSTIKSLKSTGKTTIYSGANVAMDNDILEKIRQIIKSSNKSVEEVFKQFDTDNSGCISSIEFRNAIRTLNIGLSSREIDKLLAKIDVNGDGKIDYTEFMQKFKPREIDVRLMERSQKRLAKLREYMYSYMLSPKDAFRYYDVDRTGKLTYNDFAKMITKLYECANEEKLTYTIIKDLFDAIDIRKDGIIDSTEWMQTFKTVEKTPQEIGNNQEMVSWEDSKEYEAITSIVSRNRKLLLEKFAYQAKGGNTLPIEDAKTVLNSLLADNNLTDYKYKVILRVAEKEGQVDYKKLLEVYKNRTTGKNVFPKVDSTF